MEITAAVLEENTMNEQELKIQKAQLRHMRFQSTLLSLMLVIVLVVGAAVGYTAMTVQRQVDQLDPVLINETIVLLEDIAQDLHGLDTEVITKAVVSLTEAAETLGQMNMDDLNDSIRALGAAADTLKVMDIQGLNELIESLQRTAEQMEKTTSIFARIFG